MAKKRIDRDKIINAFLSCAFEKSAGAVSLADIATLLGVNKASLYNHFSSRDEIYDATIDLCAQYMARVQFIAIESDTPISVFLPDGSAPGSEHRPRAYATFDNALTQIITRYFRSYELEPLFYMYTFIHSNKFFSQKAADAALNETQKIIDGMIALAAHYAINNTVWGNAHIHTEQHALFFAHALSAQLSEYIVHKKEMIRLNPESGAGSLFALASDDTALSSVIASAIQYWKC